MQRRATGLLLLAAAVFVVATVFQRHHPWVAWVQATAVAATVGGLADWFAITALFRRPLGLPIPHTAIVVERKERFGETLGAFVQESFLSPAAVVDRLRAAGSLPRAAAWLAVPENADRVAGYAADVLAAGSQMVDSEDVHALFDTVVRERLARVALAPLAGRALDQLTREQRHQQLVEAALAGLSGYLRDHGEELYRRLDRRADQRSPAAPGAAAGAAEGRRARWWLPGPVESRVVRRLLARAEAVLADMAADRTHPLRVQIDEGLVELAARLSTSPELRWRGDQLRDELLGHPQLRKVAESLWRDGREHLRQQADDESSPLRRRLSQIVGRAGARLRDDPDLAASAQGALEEAVTAVLERFDTELAGLVSGTISRWDAAETSRRLELLLGPDLQYIRINGTVVGGLAGLVLHVITRFAG